MLDTSELPLSIFTFLFTIGKRFAVGHQLQQELEKAREGAANAKLELSIAHQQIIDLQQDQQLGIDQQAALAAHFNELTLEVEITKSSSQVFLKAAVESTNALRATLINLQVKYTSQ